MRRRVKRMNITRAKDMPAYRRQNGMSLTPYQNDSMKRIITHKISGGIVQEMEDSIFCMSQELIEELVRVAINRRGKDEHRKK